MGLDLERNRKISALLKQGDELKRRGSPECVDLYSEAFRLAAGNDDLLRGGEALLALATACGRLLGDPVKYEHFAREAASAAGKLGALGEGLLVRAKLSLGNAIAEQVQAGVAEPSRLAEARASLSLAAASDAADAFTRASARNGLGMVESLLENPVAAAEAFLAAAAGFESEKRWNALAAAQANASRALLTAGRAADAEAVAAEGFATMNRLSQVNPNVRRILELVHEQATADD